MPVQVFLAPVAVALGVVPGRQVFAHLQLPARESGARADVEVFPVHEELLVEAAHLAVGLAAKQHEQAGNPRRYLRAHVAGLLAPDDLEGREQRPVRLGRVLARLQDARRQQAGIGDGLGEQRRQHVAVEADVRVQHQEPGRGAALERLVVIGAEALGARVLDPFHLEAPVPAREQVRLGNVQREHHLGGRFAAVTVQLVEQRQHQRELAVAHD